MVAVTEAGPAETGSAEALSAVAARGVSKWFGPAPALDAVDFTVRPGDVHRLDWYSAHDWKVPYPGDMTILPPNQVPGHNLPAGYLGD